MHRGPVSILIEIILGAVLRVWVVRLVGPILLLRWMVNWWWWVMVL